MHKITLLIAISCLLLLTSFAGEKSGAPKLNRTDIEELNLKGRIHSVSECLFEGDVKSNKVYKTSNVAQKTDSTWFDERGNKVDEKIYSASNKILNEWNYTYDGNENMTVFTFYAKGKQRQKDSYKYDSLNRVVEWVRVRGVDSLIEKDTYVYDTNGHQCETDVDERYPIRQNLKRFFDFDKNGNKIKEREFCLGRSEIQKYAWKYDGAGRVIEEDDFSTQETVKAKILFTYNNGHLTEKKTCLADGSVIAKEEYTYNAKGQKAVLDMYNNLGKLYHYFTYSYDASGNAREEKEFKVFGDEPPQLENDDVYELTYDKTGNWVKKTDLKLDGTVTIAEREISYY